MKLYRPIAAAALAALTSGAWAAGTHGMGEPGARAEFERERAACLQGHTQQSQADCMKEARNAYADARRGRLEEDASGPAQLQANQLARCQYVPADQREDCQRIARGEGTVSGSVEGGGVLKELVTRTVQAPADSGPQQ